METQGEQTLKFALFRDKDMASIIAKYFYILSLIETGGLALQEDMDGNINDLEEQQYTLEDLVNIHNHLFHLIYFNGNGVLSRIAGLIDHDFSKLYVSIYNLYLLERQVTHKFLILRFIKQLKTLLNVFLRCATNKLQDTHVYTTELASSLGLEYNPQTKRYIYIDEESKQRVDINLDMDGFHSIESFFAVRTLLLNSLSSSRNTSRIHIVQQRSDEGIMYIISDNDSEPWGAKKVSVENVMYARGTILKPGENIKLNQGGLTLVAMFAGQRDRGWYEDNGLESSIPSKSIELFEKDQQGMKSIRLTFRYGYTLHDYLDSINSQAS